MARLHWLDVALSPLTWLARARGRWRLLLLAGYGLILATIGVLVGREAVLWRLPDAPEPFDLAKSGHVDLPDADNAMVLYRRADQLRVNKPEVFRDLPFGTGTVWDWRRADPRILPWIEANRPALDAWLAGTSRPDSLFVQPAEFRYNVDLGFSVFDSLGLLAQMASLEATRRQGSGDLAGAWTEHRAVIRSALHATRHTGYNGSALGGRIIRQALPGLLSWVNEPGMTPELLRGAIADLKACRALESPDSAMIRVEYFAARDLLGDYTAWEHGQQHQGEQPGTNREDLWLNHFPAFLAVKYFWDNEPKRSRRVLRLITLGQLAQCDRPAADRPAVVSPEYLIYALDPTTPPPLNRIRPEQLAVWADAPGYRDVNREPGWALAMNATRRNQLDTLRLRLAERAYALDHVEQPPTTYGDLLSTYIDALPPGIAPGDTLAAP